VYLRVNFLELIVPHWRQRASIFRFVRESHVFLIGKLSSHTSIVDAIIITDHACPRVRLVLHAAGESNSPMAQKLFFCCDSKIFKAQPPNPSMMLERVSFPSLLMYRRSST